ncbi:hypothetical protein Droror1_Dr00010210 [Drosera rotundifolia]
MFVIDGRRVNLTGPSHVTLAGKGSKTTHSWFMLIWPQSFSQIPCNNRRGKQSAFHDHICVTVWCYYQCGFLSAPAASKAEAEGPPHQYLHSSPSFATTSCIHRVMNGGTLDEVRALEQAVFMVVLLGEVKEHVSADANGKVVGDAQESGKRERVW